MKAKLIKAIKIDSLNHVVTEVMIERGKLADMYKHIGCDCMDLVRSELLLGGDALFVDDEGLINDKHMVGRCKIGFTIAGYGGALVGNGLIVGANDEGESIDAETPLDVVSAFVRFGTFGRAA